MQVIDLIAISGVLLLFGLCFSAIAKLNSIIWKQGRYIDDMVCRFIELTDENIKLKGDLKTISDKTRKKACDKVIKDVHRAFVAFDFDHVSVEDVKQFINYLKNENGYK